MLKLNKIQMNQNNVKKKNVLQQLRSSKKEPNSIIQKNILENQVTSPSTMMSIILGGTMISSTNLANFDSATCESFIIKKQRYANIKLWRYNQNSVKHVDKLGDVKIY